MLRLSQPLFFATAWGVETFSPAPLLPSYSPRGRAQKAFPRNNLLEHTNLYQDTNPKALHFLAAIYVFHKRPLREGNLLSFRIRSTYSWWCVPVFVLVALASMAQVEDPIVVSPQRSPGLADDNIHSASLPLVVGVLELCRVDQDPPELMPLVVLENGAWSGEHITEFLSEIYADEPRVSSKATRLAELMLQQTFYSSRFAELRFMPEHQEFTNIIDSRYLALAGSLEGVRSPKADEQTLVFASLQPVCLKSKPAHIEKDLLILDELLTHALGQEASESGGASSKKREAYSCDYSDDSARLIRRKAPGDSEGFRHPITPCARSRQSRGCR